LFSPILPSLPGRRVPRPFFLPYCQPAFLTSPSCAGAHPVTHENIRRRLKQPSRTSIANISLNFNMHIWETGEISAMRGMPIYFRNRFLLRRRIRTCLLRCTSEDWANPAPVHPMPGLEQLKSAHNVRKDSAGMLGGKYCLRQWYEGMRVNPGAHAAQFQHCFCCFVRILFCLARQTENKIDDHLVSGSPGP
jgi:hypothetical protein